MKLALRLVMAQMINTNTWKEFRVGDLFDIHPTKAYKLTNAQLLDGGDYPVAANSAYDNGIGGYSTQKPTEKGNMITFSDTVDVNTIFYQPDDFVGYPHVQGLYPLRYKDKWNKYTYLFFISAFRGAAISKGFDYGNKFRRDIAVDLIIKLPVSSDDQLDWIYMESYMKQIIEDSQKSLENLKKVDSTKRLINIDEWSEFKITDLFDMSLPKGDLQVKKVEDGDVPLITPSNFNNGMLQRISKHSPSTLYKKGSLTVDMFGNAYYQEEDFFVTAHGHVNVLIPKIVLNEYTGTFLASAIRAMFLDKYDFSEMCTLKVLKMKSIKLPVASAGKPNWQYMDNYMQKQFKKSELAIAKLQPGIYL